MRSFAALLILLFCTSCEPSSAQSQGGGVTHQVREGETLYAIAAQYYGNGLLWPEIRRHNPWVQPGQLHEGETIYIPSIHPDMKRHSVDQANRLNPPYDDVEYEQDEAPEDEPEEVSEEYEEEPEEGSGSYANLPPGVGAAGTWVSGVSSKQLFGVPLHHAALTALCGLLTHSLVQSVLVWLAAVLTFVKDTSFRKSLKAVFLAESLTFTMVCVLGALAVIMFHVGSSSEELQQSQQLFPTLEAYMSTPTGIFVAVLVLLTLYSVLSLRFYPQVMKVKSGQAFPILILAVLLPHLLGMYLVGQRLGIIPAY